MNKQYGYTGLVFGLVLMVTTACGKAPTNLFETAFDGSVSSVQYFKDGTYVAAVIDVGDEQGTYTLSGNVYSMKAQSGTTSSCTVGQEINGSATMSCTNTNITPNTTDEFKVTKVLTE